MSEDHGGCGEDTSTVVLCVSREMSATQPLGDKHIPIISCVLHLLQFLIIKLLLVLLLQQTEAF